MNTSVLIEGEGFGVAKMRTHVQMNYGNNLSRGVAAWVYCKKEVDP